MIYISSLDQNILFYTKGITVDAFIYLNNIHKLIYIIFRISEYNSSVQIHCYINQNLYIYLAYVHYVWDMQIRDFKQVVTFLFVHIKKQLKHLDASNFS
jgi:hypothetical protein